LELRVDLDGKERRNFLQPPHFRTPCTDDFLDQVASRFGRGALDLDGPYYHAKHRTEIDEDDDDDDEDEGDLDVDTDVYALTNLRGKLDDYLKKQMGSQDIYACPVCYCQSHRLLVDPEADHNDENIATESIYDPMHVLGHLDNDAFEIASQFCFTRASDVKKHLRDDHNIDPRGVQGNDLYMRYRVRAPDGLLQRWLIEKKFGTVNKQGYMKMYWNDEGNNQNFILLLDTMKQAKVYEDELYDEDIMNPKMKDLAEEFIQAGRVFFDSFLADAPEQWKRIAAPFLKSSENMKDFIAEDGDVGEVSESEINHAMLHRELAAKDEESDENDFAHKLQRKYADNDVESSDQSESDDELEVVGKSENAQEEEEDLAKIKGYYSPVEEEQDEWVLKKLDQCKRKSISSATKEGSASKRRAAESSTHKTPTGKKLFKRKSTPSATKTPNPLIQVSSTKKRTPAIHESDDEES
jgi:hypothetical protein